MTTTWIIAVEPQVAALVEIGRGLGGDVVVVAAGSDGSAFAGADRVIAVPADSGVPAEALAPAVAAAVSAQSGDVVLAADRPAERVLAGATAARLAAPFVSGAVHFAAGAVQVARYGGLVLETVAVAGPVVAVVDGGGAAAGDAPEIETAAADAYPATVTAENTVEVQQVDLGTAKRIIAVGRGFKAQEDLALARDLASAMGSTEVACSRPLAEGQDWFAKSRYIGVSGQSVSPEVYVAVGISGQMQHMSGAQNSSVVVAINSDANAPIFAQADYGIVGDLYDVLPALTDALK